MDVTLGQNPHSLSMRWFDGLLDDMRIYSRALTVEDVQAVMRGKGPGVTGELAGPPATEDEGGDVWAVRNWWLQAPRVASKAYLGAKVEM